MIVLALIGLAALAVGALTLARVRSRSERQSVETFDPVRVEREVYDHLYGPRPALRAAPAPPANQTRQRARRPRRKLNTKRPATGRAAH
jgi:hypothetical protein